jgi:hypothetical protein
MKFCMQVMALNIVYFELMYGKQALVLPKTYCFLMLRYMHSYAACYVAYMYFIQVSLHTPSALV